MTEKSKTISSWWSCSENISFCQRPCVVCARLTLLQEDETDDTLYVRWKHCQTSSIELEVQDTPCWTWAWRLRSQAATAELRVQCEGQRGLSFPIEKQLWLGKGSYGRYPKLTKLYRLSSCSWEIVSVKDFVTLIWWKKLFEFSSYSFCFSWMYWGSLQMTCLLVG